MTNFEQTLESEQLVREATFVPRYRVAIRIAATDVHASVTFEDASPSNSMTTQTEQAIAYARMVHSSRDDIEITRVERQGKVDGSWEELTTAFRAVPGTQVKIVSWSRDCHRTELVQTEKVDWVKVGRWHGLGDGTAALIAQDGRHMGIYPKNFVFVTR
jgi:hypothetical protein